VCCGGGGDGVQLVERVGIQLEDNAAETEDQTFVNPAWIQVSTSTSGSTNIIYVLAVVLVVAVVVVVVVEKRRWSDC